MALIVGVIALACTLVLIYVALRIGAAILRTSVQLTNATLGGRELDEEDFRYRGAAHDPVPRPKSLGGIRIPVPGVGYAILVNIVSAVASWVCQIVATVAAVALFGLTMPEPTGEPTAALAGALGVLALSLGSGLFGTLLVLKYTLPTTFFRAGVVVVWQVVICTVIGAIMVGVLFALGAAGGDGFSVPAGPGQGGWVR